MIETIAQSMLSPFVFPIWIALVFCIFLLWPNLSIGARATTASRRELRSSRWIYAHVVSYAPFVIAALVVILTQSPPSQAMPMFVFGCLVAGFLVMSLTYSVAYRLTWDDEGITEKTLFGTRRFLWAQADAPSLALAREVTEGDRQIKALRFGGKPLSLAHMRTYVHPSEAFLATMRAKLDLPPPARPDHSKNWFR